MGRGEMRWGRVGRDGLGWGGEGWGGVGLLATLSDAVERHSLLFGELRAVEEFATAALREARPLFRLRLHRL